MRPEDITLDLVLEKMTAVSAFLSKTLTLRVGVIVLCAGTALLALLFFFLSAYRTGLLVNAAAGGGKGRLGVAGVLSILFDTLCRLARSLLVFLPLLAALAAALFLVNGVLKATLDVHEFVEREKRIRELSIAVKYLEQNDKVLDVRVESVTNGVTRLRLSYAAAALDGGAVPPAEWKKVIDIPGTDIFFDCLVLNFTYSEIGSGRQANIALPYRVFSDQVPAKDGVSLLESSADIPEEDDFGFIPSLYRERLRQLLTDPAFAEDLGVRSVNGSAPHRRVQAGDRFTIRIEQSGGMSIN